MNKKIYKCLVASPGDTSIERQICIKIFDELNKGIGEKFGFVIEKRMWEHNTRPSFGDYSQAVISDQLGDDYDVFIGLMYKKFGTETKAAGSGTEEEFNNAYNRLINKENVEIMFYFNDEPSKISDINGTDLAKIIDFKSKVAKLGGYYWNYNGSSDFESVFRVHLTDLFLKKFSGASHKLLINKQNYEVIKIKNQERLDNALRAFNSQPIIWVEPVLSDTNDISRNPDENYERRLDLSKIIESPESIIIKAPAQFGLTSLSFYLIKEAWEKGDLWIYLDSNKTKAHNIHNSVIREAESLSCKKEEISAIILDSWNSYEIESFKKLKSLTENYKNIPIIVMHTIDDSKFMSEENDIKIDREFKTLHLLALPRKQIRKVVSEYNKVKEIGSEDVVLTKVVSDLDVLNIHRTPMNCLTLLKVAEKYFDESPINRTDMIEKVLFVLFNMDDLPRYRTKPDLKDCEYVLGRFCEQMIKDEKYIFSRDIFINELRSFCTEKLIDLEVDVVFDILYANNIIIRREIDYCFRASYWIYYFGAKRMHNEKSFADYIFENRKYICFPEIIEFYTGIDRNKIDALEILTDDIRKTCDIVDSKVRLPENMNPFSLIRWQPTDEQIQKVQDELSENVINSGLPDDIKDQHADRSYNQIQPYNQNIHSFFEEYSLHNLMQNIRASSRALRNSDYVNPEAKRLIFKEILRSWEEISKVLLALTPILADRGEAHFEGHGFLLSGDFGDTFETRVNRIIQVNMTNVVGFFKDDIFSSKLAPLFYEHFNIETDPKKKHQLALLIVFTRPREWKKVIEGYIISLNKNSFFLFDTYNALLAKYNYGYLREGENREIAYLMKMCFAKHEYGSKKPGLHEIAKVQIAKTTEEN